MFVIRVHFVYGSSAEFSYVEYDVCISEVLDFIDDPTVDYIELVAISARGVCIEDLCLLADCCEPHDNISEDLNMMLKGW